MKGEVYQTKSNKKQRTPPILLLAGENRWRAQKKCVENPRRQKVYINED